MQLDLSELIVRRGMRVELVVDQPHVEDPDLVFAEPLRGRLTFQNADEMIHIHGGVDSALVVACARCLADVRIPVRLDVSELFSIQEVLHPSLPQEDSGFDTTVSSVVHLEQGRPILDLDELLRQLIVAEIPIRTLCDETCAGLCPRCGANLNEGPCGCPPEIGNRPLAGLARLLEQADGLPE